jgi:hypothetical protein
MEPEKPHFHTCTIVAWLPIFNRPEAVKIILDSWRFLQHPTVWSSMDTSSSKTISTLWLRLRIWGRSLAISNRSPRVRF